MSLLRLALVSTIFVFAIACGSGYSSPASPSPTQSATPAPDSPSSSLTIPAGAGLRRDRTGEATLIPGAAAAHEIRPSGAGLPVIVGHDSRGRRIPRESSLHAR